MNNAPIGILDSGSGGLSLYLQIKKLLPHESFIYIGDHANLPYGDKTMNFIRGRVMSILKYLTDRHVKIIVIACNTATVAGIAYYRRQYPDIPIIGIVPVVKTAAAQSKTKRFVILSTDFTAKSLYQKRLIKTFASDCDVVSVGSTILVPFIEEGNRDSENIRKELQRMLGILVKNSYDVIALGCSHYPFVREAIRAIVGSGVTILDSADAVARQIKRILGATHNESGSEIPVEEFLTTGDPKKVSEVCSSLLQKNIKVSHVFV